MSKSLMSLVWIAGPMSGTLGQPIVGMFSDGLRWSYGRRRPFMIGGATATILSLLCLSWSMDIVSFLTGVKADPETGDSTELRNRTIPFAVIFVYLLDFSISVIQASARAFIVDNVPTSQQQVANAWAARMIGIGNIAGFILGSVNLPRLFPWLGNTQFKVLSSCASLALVFTVFPACIGISELDPRLDPTISKSAPKGQGLVRVWTETIRAIKHLSPQTKLACQIEFFAWIGYFPMLFYSSTYVGILYKQQHRSEHDSHDVDTPELNEEATRKGSIALLIFALVSLAANFLLPYLSTDAYSPLSSRSSARYGSTTSSVSLFTRLSNLFLRKLTVSQLWIFGHVVFVVAMIGTFWISTAKQAMVFVGFLGIPWALALWAPFVLIAEEVSRIKNKKGALQRVSFSVSNIPKRRFETYEHEAGIILGVHNMFVALPQVVSSLMASLLFKILDSDEESASSIRWVFQFGGIATIVAIYLSCKLMSKSDLDMDDETLIES